MSNVASIKRPDQLHNIDYIRDYIRAKMPMWGGGNGFVALDMDLILRVYGPQYNSNQIGRFALIELKKGDGDLTTAQYKTFNQMDTMLRVGDVRGDQYAGSYVLRYSLELGGVDCGSVQFLKLERLFTGGIVRDVLIEDHHDICQWMETLPIPEPMEVGF
jgi:hypothetical protein